MNNNNNYDFSSFSNTIKKKVICFIIFIFFLLGLFMYKQDINPFISKNDKLVANKNEDNNVVDIIENQSNEMTAEVSEVGELDKTTETNGDKTIITEKNSQNSLTPYELDNLKNETNKLYDNYVNIDINVTDSERVDKLNVMRNNCSRILEYDEGSINFIRISVFIDIQLAIFCNNNDDEIKFYSNAILTVENNFNYFEKEIDILNINYYYGQCLFELGKLTTNDNSIEYLEKSHMIFNKVINYQTYESMKYIISIGSILYDKTYDIEYLERSVYEIKEVDDLDVSQIQHSLILKELGDSYYKIAKYYKSINNYDNYEHYGLIAKIIQIKLPNRYFDQNILDYLNDLEVEL